MLLAPRLDAGAREAFLDAMGKSTTPRNAAMPVIAFSTPLEEAPPEEGILSVPWPCETRVLVGRIEAALLDAPAASSASTTDSA